MNKEQINLKHCPFCGHNAETYQNDLGNWTVYCEGEDDNPGCSINIGWFKTEQEAINKWNTRVTE